MCGLAGMWGPSADPRILKNMLESIAHRGPDGQQQVVYGQGCFGHARLSIIDLSGGTQPIWNEKHDHLITVNGEVYGYQEIQDQLVARGHSLATKSDSEVLLHLFEEKKERFLDRINGEFAGVISDGESIVLFRDWAGIKPLYYRFLADGTLAYASEIKALKTLGHAKVNIFELERVFAHAPSKDRTIYSGIFCVPPGTILHVSRHMKLTISSYRKELLDKREPIDLQSAFLSSVKERLIADVPVGIYLSGGMDSNAVAQAVMNCGYKPKAFSIRFSDRAVDESPLIDAAAREMGISLEYCSGDRLEDDLASYLKSVEMVSPYVHGVAKWRLSRLVRSNGYKVVLTGEGADELFGGYQSFVFLRFADFIRRKPKFRNLALKAFSDYQKGRAEQGDWHTQLGEFVDSSLSIPVADVKRLATIRSLFNPDLLKEFEVLPPVSDSTVISSKDPLDHWRWHFIEHSLPGFVLVFLGDRVEMANSIEARTPFLDPRVAAAAFQTPVRKCVIGTSVKVPTRKLPKPKAIQNIDKRMFFARQNPVLRYFESYLEDISNGKSQIFVQRGNSEADQMIQLQTEILFSS